MVYIINLFRIFIPELKGVVEISYIGTHMYLIRCLEIKLFTICI